MKQITLQELMEEIKITEKKLNKKTMFLIDHSHLTFSARPQIGMVDKENGEKPAYSYNQAKNKVQSELQSFDDLIKRLAVLKRIRDDANRNNTVYISVEDKEDISMTIYDAIVYKNSIHGWYDTLINKVETVRSHIQRQNVSEINSNPNPESLVSTEPQYLIDSNLYDEIREKAHILIQRIDVAITIANVKTIVEVPE